MANDNSLEPPYDCIIIGGGPAGIYAYRVLARQRYRVIVLDAGLYQHNLSSDTSYRTNRRSDPTLSYLDHLNNNAFVPSSEIQVEAATISSTKALQNGHYEASDTAGRTWRGRTLLLAVGMRTVFPDLPGYQDCWNGTICSNAFCCDFSHDSASSVGVLAIGESANTSDWITSARMARRIAKHVTIYTDNDEALSEQLRTDLGSGNIKVEARTISRLESQSDGSEVVVHFNEGPSSVEDMMLHEPKAELNGPFALQLGLDLGDQGHIKVEEHDFSTCVPGVYAVGSCAVATKATIHAIATGALGAMAVSAHLTQSVV